VSVSQDYADSAELIDAADRSWGMKVIVFLAVFFFKWSLLGVPLWVCISVLAPLALALAYWYRRLKKRSEAQSAGELVDVADTYGDISDGEDATR
jgi:membrane protein implicated in regulation of membrane protease activity